MVIYSLNVNMNLNILSCSLFLAYLMVANAPERQEHS